MKVYTGNQINLIDQQTIEFEGIKSIDLMERASQKLADYIINNILITKKLYFVIGKGNNGGDGLAMARILSNQGYTCSVFVPKFEGEATEQMKINLERLPIKVKQIDSLQDIGDSDIVIDALLGSGTMGCVRPYYQNVIECINNLPNDVISLDLPSGMCSEYNPQPNYLVKAYITLTIQYPKLAMLLSEAGNYCGKIVIIDINLKTDNIDSKYNYITKDLINSLLIKSEKFDYKNKNGHTLLICGCQEMIGAAVLTTSAALRSGCGLITSHIPYKERHAIQISTPSAMISIDNANYFSTLPENLDKYNSAVVGPGLGTKDETVKALRELLTKIKYPIIIDADAINIIGNNPEMINLIPKGSILTPHIGELRRIISWNSTREMLQNTLNFASKTQSYIIIKGAHSAIVCPDGDIFFNSSGCSSMARAGSGDILAGLLGGLLARGYSSLSAAIIGVYHHGIAGEKASIDFGNHSMNSKDILNYLNF